MNLGAWLGFGHSALRADGLAGIFLALTGITGGAVSLAYAELPAGRWLTTLASTPAAVHRGRDRLRQRVPVLPRLGGDHRLRVPDRERRQNPRRPPRRLSHRRAREARRRGAARRIRAAVRAHAQLLAGRVAATRISLREPATCCSRCSSPASQQRLACCPCKAVCRPVTARRHDSAPPRCRSRCAPGSTDSGASSSTCSARCRPAAATRC